MIVKTPIKTMVLQDYSDLFKALGEETRLKMIGLLDNRELCVCDFMEVLELVQSTASRHLAYLKNSGWVIGRREGKWMYYRLHPDTADDPFQQAIIRQLAGLPEIRMICEVLEAYLLQKGESGRCS